MGKNLTAAETEQSLGGVTIPARPGILVDLDAERSRENPDLKRIAKLIGQDVALSAAVLKVVNSPIYGLARRVGSIPQAVSLLGLSNLGNLITSLMLRQNLGDARELQPFWEHSAQLAQVTAMLARHVRGVSPDLAYSFGLFRDCGMPLMLQRFPQYSPLLLTSAQYGLAELVEEEDRIFQACHCRIGYLLARTWFMPAALMRAIALHHDLAVLHQEEVRQNPLIGQLIALAQLADNFLRRHFNLPTAASTVAMNPVLAEFLGLGAQELDDLYEEVEKMLQIEVER